MHFHDCEFKSISKAGLKLEALFEKYTAPNYLPLEIEENREWFINDWLLIIFFSVEELQNISSSQPSQLGKFNLRGFLTLPWSRNRFWSIKSTWTCKHKNAVYTFLAGLALDVL